MAWYSQTWTWFDGAWHEGNPGIVGPRSHVLWQSSSVFDGGRYFDGVAPDIDLHAARVNRSATALGLKPTVEADFIVGKMFEGVKKFAPGTAIYVKPMYWGEADGPSTIMPDPESVSYTHLDVYKRQRLRRRLRRGRVGQGTVLLPDHADERLRLCGRRPARLAGTLAPRMALGLSLIHI